jgi:phosphate starvation-inducible protein PhoH and related proteins
MSKQITSKKVTPTSHDIKNRRQALKELKNKDWTIQFRNRNQKRFYDMIEKKDITFCTGPAGCGKTYLSVHYALKALADKDTPYDGIVIVKPLVEADGEKLGFLPGNVEEKTEPFMMSFYYNMEQLIGKHILDILRQEEIVKVIPMAYMRGLTLSNKIVILDETQNATPAQIKMFLTRLGFNSKYIIAGDLEQTDKRGVNGLDDSIRRFAGIRGVGLSMFTAKDIVRHKLIAKLLARYENEFDLSDADAEMTISKWVHLDEAELPSDSSIDNSKINYKLQ